MVVVGKLGKSGGVQGILLCLEKEATIVVVEVEKRLVVVLVWGPLLAATIRNNI